MGIRLMKVRNVVLNNHSRWLVRVVPQSSVRSRQILHKNSSWMVWVKQQLAIRSWHRELGLNRLMRMVVGEVELDMGSWMMVVVGRVELAVARLMNVVGWLVELGLDS